ncbi:toprim domain-containing protein [Nocardia gipuzkoensis]|uniref:toprim domain-containing protein n=1 Tax=Nocardia gipuzkoensis TaxID=2749991 RepID=UPI00237E82E2|nr:toprim domain-containing protein [Nocardia gipuzkoensis]MDE1674359.1 toprim domain-containing protein [Nocardia gipuzkoensis]
MAAPARPRPAGSWERVTEALERAVGPGRPAGSWVKYCCPVHEADGRGHRPSLGAKYIRDMGRTKVRCYAGCSDEQVLEAVGLRVKDLYDAPIERGQHRGPARAPRPRPQRVSRADQALGAAGLPLVQPKRPDLGAQTSPWKRVAVYPYLRADGAVAGEVVRKEAEFERGRDKEFGQRRWNSATGEMQAGGFEAIPFQLPQLLEGVAAGRVIYVVEGEKDVLAAESAGLIATCNARGALSWSAEHAGWLKGAGTVVIVADRDTAGYRRAEKVMASLTGLVERVRVVQALTGKDLTDHFACGHTVGELEPIPYLDPYTPAPVPAPGPVRAASAGPAPPAPTVAADPDVPAEKPAPGGTLMAEYLLAPSLDTPPPQSDEVDHMHSQWSIFAKLLMQHLLMLASKAAAQRLAAAAAEAEKSEEERKAAEERRAAEKAAIETRLRKLRQAGYDTASRTEIADAVRDAATWANDSEVAGIELGHLAEHVGSRFGVDIDIVNGEAHVIASADPAMLAAAEQDRAALARDRTAQDRAVEIVAADDDIDESTKIALYAAIESWRTDPSHDRLETLTRQLKDKKVTEQTRNRVRFVFAYLGDDTQIGSEETGNAVSAAQELASHARPLVDPGEEAKARIDTLLETYQEQLKVGAPTHQVQQQLAGEVEVLTMQDQEATRERGKAIRANPAGNYPRLWPNHVDRDELTTHIRAYATLAPQAEAAAGQAGDLADVTAVQLRKTAARHKAAIKEALTTGEGLHPLEKDQLRAVLRDIDAGKTDLPEQLFADDRSAARVDINRCKRIAHDNARARRRDLDKILDDAAVPEQVRKQIREHLDHTTSAVEQSTQQVATTTRRWAERREAVVVSRVTAGAESADYDSPQRQQDMERQLRGAGLDDDQIAERMAAESSFAKPPSAAAKAAKLNPRTTNPGAGMQRFNHRGKGKGNGQNPDQGTGR